jgi:hypothetical protein
MKRLILLVVAGILAFSALGYASGKCIIDGSPLMWTGQINTEGGKMLYDCKCLQDHHYWSLSANCN